MKTNVERIVEFLNKNNIDEAVFEKKAGIANGIIKNNLKNNGKFSDKTLEKILIAYPDIRKEWLYLGKGKMLISDPEEKPDQIDQAEMEALKQENKRLKDEVLELSRKLIEILTKKSTP